MEIQTGRELNLDRDRCTRCGRCIKMMGNYCISSDNGFPVFDGSVCNLCQKCVAICPSRAIMVNGIYPDPVDGPHGVDPEKLIRLMERRRSIKRFRDEPLPPEVIGKIAASAKYAPNQNKNISLLIVENRELIWKIDENAVAFYQMIYRFLFGFKPLTAFIRLCYRDIDMIKRKMEYDLKIRKGIVKKNTQALLILTGDKNLAVTENSAHYVMAAMMFTAETLGVGNTLMDSLLLCLNGRRKLRKKLGLAEDVLAVLALGYSAEEIINVPRGYELDIRKL